MKIDDFAEKEPKLLLEEYFLGQTQAWGIFEDRFGNLKRSFQVSIIGTMQDGRLILEEDFIYDDGEEDRRVWTITPLGDGQYQGTADDVVGVAEGRVAGNALNWQYRLNLPVGEKVYEVKFDDWMYLQPGDVLVNKANVSKWGLHLGTVLLFFTKEPAADLENLKASANQLKVVGNENTLRSARALSTHR